MKDFIFWIKNDVGYLVNHSKYWSEFDKQFGRNANQVLLHNLLTRESYHFQEIDINDSKVMYDRFMCYLFSQGIETIRFTSQNRHVISHDFACLTESQLNEWVKELKSACNSSSSPVKRHATVLDSPLGSQQQQEAQLITLEHGIPIPIERGSDEEMQNDNLVDPIQNNSKNSWFSWFM